jgi:hypothetical protein
MPDNTCRLFTDDRIRPCDLITTMHGGATVPSTFAAANLTTWLNEASCFTLRLVSFSSYGEDTATWVDYDALGNPITPPSWMWARFSEDRVQVNMEFSKLSRRRRQPLRAHAPRKQAHLQVAGSHLADAD